MNKRNCIIQSTIAVALTAVALSACVTPSGTQQTPAQIAAQACPIITSSIGILQADTGLSGSAQNVLSSVAPKIAPICSAASQATSNDVQTLSNFAFQVVIPIAEVANPKVAADLTALQLIFGIVEATQQPAATTSTPAPVKTN